MPSAARLARHRVLPNVASLARQRVLPNVASLARHRVLPVSRRPGSSEALTAAAASPA